LVEIVIPVPPGELVDKITILEIKAQRLTDTTKLRNVRRELNLLCSVRERELPRDSRLTDLQQQLMEVNAAIWDLENAIRRCEANSNFGEEFVAIARRVYERNDRRAQLKREINLYLGSDLMEEKSYRELAAVKTSRA
jgi:Family of unknown function (DUF6165)